MNRRGFFAMLPVFAAMLAVRSAKPKVYPKVLYARNLYALHGEKWIYVNGSRNDGKSCALKEIIRWRIKSYKAAQL